MILGGKYNHQDNNMYSSETVPRKNIDVNRFFDLQKKIHENIFIVAEEEKKERIQNNIFIWENEIISQETLDYIKNNNIIPQWVSSPLSRNIEKKDSFHSFFIHDSSQVSSDYYCMSVMTELVSQGFINPRSYLNIAEEELLSFKYSGFEGREAWMRVLDCQTIFITGVGGYVGSLKERELKLWSSLLHNRFNKNKNIILSSCISFQEFLSSMNSSIQEKTLLLFENRVCEKPSYNKPLSDIVLKL